MNSLTDTQLTNFLQRANCCFADVAYKSTKAFAIGNFEKGLCEFQKAESLHHYIQALRCFHPVDSEVIGTPAVAACGMTEYIIGPDTLTPGPGDVFTVTEIFLDALNVTPDVLLTSPTADGLNGILVLLAEWFNDEYGYTVTILGENLVICMPYDVSNPTNIYITIDLRDPLALVGFRVYNYFTDNFPIGGGSPASDITIAEEGDYCISSDNADSLIEKINSTCPYCCHCVDFDYELTNDTL